MWRVLALGATPNKRAAVLRQAAISHSSPSCWQRALFLSALLVRAEEQNLSLADDVYRPSARLRKPQSLPSFPSFFMSLDGLLFGPCLRPGRRTPKGVDLAGRHTHL